MSYILAYTIYNPVSIQVEELEIMDFTFSHFASQSRLTDGYMHAVSERNIFSVNLENRFFSPPYEG